MLSRLAPIGFPNSENIEYRPRQAAYKVRLLCELDIFPLISFFLRNLCKTSSHLDFDTKLLLSMAWFQNFKLKFDYFFKLFSLSKKLLPNYYILEPYKPPYISSDILQNVSAYQKFLGMEIHCIDYIFLHYVL